MASNNNTIKNIKHKPNHQNKSQILQQHDCKSIRQKVQPFRDKIKGKPNREKTLVKQQIRKVASIHKNEIKMQGNENQSSEMFSRKNSSQYKFSFRKLNQNLGNINSNGFSVCPPPFTQLVPVLLIILMTLELVVLSVQYFQDFQKYIILGIGSFIILPITYLWYITTSICPTDQIQLQHLQYLKDPNSITFAVKKYKFFCNLCKTCIGQKSFHCNKCNRCVQYFDHHCKWLNNCIGSKNYVQFFQLVVCSQIFMIFFYIVNVILMLDIVKNHDIMPSLLWYAVVVMIIVLAPFISISMLLCLHMYLIIAKRSTIQLILQSRRKNKIHPQNKQELNQKKIRQSIPIQSQSLATPDLLQSQKFMLRQSKQKQNTKLQKFKQNLSKNLRLSKIITEIEIAKNQTVPQNEKKFTLKPIIIKKKSSNEQNVYTKNKKKQGRGEIKENCQVKNDNERSNQIQKEGTESYIDSNLEESSKNLVISRLKFSTKRQIIESQSYNDQISRCHLRYKSEIQQNTDRKQSLSNRKQGKRRYLQPLSKPLTQRKQKQRSVDVFNKQNVKDHEQYNNQINSSAIKSMLKLKTVKSMKNREEIDNDPKLQKKIKSIRFEDEKQKMNNKDKIKNYNPNLQQSEKPKSTRVVKIFQSKPQNQQQQAF